jgi:hypothetical protein
LLLEHRVIVLQLLACLSPVVGAMDEAVKEAAAAAAAAEELNEETARAVRVCLQLQSRNLFYLHLMTRAGE